MSTAFAQAPRDESISPRASRADDDKANGMAAKKAANPRGRRPVEKLDPECLPFDLVDAIAGLRLRGLDLEAVLLGGGREEAPHAVGLMPMSA